MILLLSEMFSHLFLLGFFLQPFGPLLLLRVLLFGGVLGDDILQTGHSHFSVRPQLAQQ